MPAPAGKVPILESVRAGYAFVASEWRALAMPAVMGAGGLVMVFSLAGSLAGALGGLFLVLLLQMSVVALVYAAFLGVAFKPAGARRAAFFGDAGRLWSAMAIVAAFLGLLFLVALLPGGVALSVVFSPYAAEIEAAQSDPVAMNALAERMLQENPAPTMLLFAIYALSWLALTSRLYLVAPATVAEDKIRTFETWPWTQGSMLRIMASRLLLLGPPGLVTFTAQSAALAWIGAQSAPSPVLVLAVLLGFLLATMVLLAAEAGLSAFLYRGLRPANP